MAPTDRDRDTDRRRSVHTASATAPPAQQADAPRHAPTIASAHAARSTNAHREPPAIAHPSQIPIAKVQVVHGTTPRRSTIGSVALSSSPGMASPGP